MSTFNHRPHGLSEAGNKAYDAIMATMGDVETGGCRTFYSPAEWAARGETYGRNAELIVVYDGGDVSSYFTYDYGFTLAEKMSDALSKVGMFAEQCTGWYSGIYNI